MHERHLHFLCTLPHRAAALAAGGLQPLHVRNHHASHVALLEVAAANAGALCEL
jgi:hypothetical protein